MRVATRPYTYTFIQYIRRCIIPHNMGLISIINYKLHLILISFLFFRILLSRFVVVRTTGTLGGLKRPLESD